MDAAGVEFGADLVGAGPVACLAGLCAVGDEPLDGVPFFFGELLGHGALV